MAKTRSQLPHLYYPRADSVRIINSHWPGGPSGNDFDSLVNDPSIVSYHRLQGTTGTVAQDESPNGNDGTYYGMGGDPVTGVGPNGWLPSAVYFDGSNDYMDYAGQVGSLSEWSIAAWIKTSQGAGDRWIFSEGSTSDDRPVIGFVNYAGKLRGFVRTLGGVNVDLRPNATISDGVWHFAQFVRDGNTFKLFLDGVEVHSVTQSLSTSPTNTSTIGALRRASVGLHAQAYAAGAIKHARALSLEEHQILFAGP